MQKHSTITTVVFLVLLVSGLAMAQSNLDDVHLFQNFLRDAAITKTIYGDGGLTYNSYDGFSSTRIGVQGGYPINPKLEVGAALGFLSLSPEKGDGESGLTDLLVSGRYNVVPGTTNISVGGYLTLPIGKEEVGQSNLDFGAYGALRHPLDNGMIITGTVGLDFIEKTTTERKITEDFRYEETEKTEYENSLVLGAGAIYPLNPQVNLVGELVMWTEGDYMMLSGGADYKMGSGGRLRGALGLGLDDGAPDLSLMVSYLLFLK